LTTLTPSQFINKQRYGVLSTCSVAETGYPFGSITPYIVTTDGEIAIFVSHLAEHTHNIQANPHVSLTIFDPKDAANPTAGMRLSCLAMAIPAQDDTSLRAIYLNKFPDSEMILNLPGFHFYLLKLVKIHLVAGFGQVKWLNAEQLSL
jgi:heme iron utilization protein